MEKFLFQMESSAATSFVNLLWIKYFIGIGIFLILVVIAIVASKKAWKRYCIRREKEKNLKDTLINNIGDLINEKVGELQILNTQEVIKRRELEELTKLYRLQNKINQKKQDL